MIPNRDGVPPPQQPDSFSFASSGRAILVIALTAAYVSYAFQLFRAGFWTSGIGDWMDPYFINALLEHWYRSAWTAADPSSPPMYFPAGGTLGYSHGLVLYAAFYGPIRLFAHPFVAYNLTLVLVVATGILTLYVLLRKLGLTFMESLILCAFFSTSRNVINGATGTWSQRASVYLIPPILLLLLVSWRMPRSCARLILAWCAGLLGALMYVQDFYTAHFAALFAVALAVPLLVTYRKTASDWITRFWRAESRPAARVALGLAVLTMVWTAVLLAAGGISFDVSGLRISSHDWQRPALIAVLAFLVFLRVRTGTVRVPDRIRNQWLAAVALGGIVGSAVFLWIYVDAYQEHRSFPEEHLLNSLVSRDPGRWNTPLDFFADLDPYDTLRSFELVFVAGILAWLPWFAVDRRTRAHAFWFLLVSFLVLLVPLRFDDFSIWRAAFEHLPGLRVIRDPSRIVYLYELAAVLMIGAFLTKLPRTSALRIGLGALAALLLMLDWNRETFATSRPIEIYERWVNRPIDIDPSCRSFFASPGPEEYSARLDNKWMLYSIDSVFVSLNRGLPTLNGYSAWFPQGWDLFNPEEEEYEPRVRQWVDRHQLHGVCELDLGMRTMKPFVAHRP